MNPLRLASAFVGCCLWKFDSIILRAAGAIARSFFSHINRLNPEGPHFTLPAIRVRLLFRIAVLPHKHFIKNRHHSRNTSPQLNSFLSFNAHLDIINSFSAVCWLRQLRSRILPKRIPYFDFFALSSFLSFLPFVLSILSLPPIQLHFPRLPELILPAGKPSHRLSWFSHWHRSRQIRRVQEVWCRLKTEEQEVWQWKREDCLKVEQTRPQVPWIKVGK